MDFNELLLSVQRPGRYVGGEWNSIKKEWAPGRAKICLAFPDVYEVGMSHLGIKILYGILNHREDVLCERVFAPWADFEKALRDNKLPLYSLESRRPLSEFDMLGISVAYELSYTNILNILDLGNIPIWSKDRTDAHPIVLAGGSGVFNPEPIADFIDAFLIGDGEDAINEIADICNGWRARSPAISRAEILSRLAKVSGVYIPSFYEVSYGEDKKINSFKPKMDSLPAMIEKRTVDNLDDAFYPVEQIVPFLQTVHDRIAIEIMRGCKHACRFCQARTTYYPWRERSREKITELARASYASTGYEEMSLLSLSSGDHTKIREVIADLNDMFKGKAVSLSVPSLRIEDALVDLPFLISYVKKAGLTFAPEAGSACLRGRLNKNIDIEKLFAVLRESFKHGWNKVKLYFMIGLPGETEDDIKSMIELLYKVSDMRREVAGKGAFVTASINPFVPKPHTPFQWRAVETRERLEEKKVMIRSSIKSKLIDLDFHSFDMSLIEALFARGDRRLSMAVYEAWKDGARFDGWKEHFNINKWLEVLKRINIDPSFYVNRAYDIDEILPWDFISIGISKDRLYRESGG